VKRLLAEATLFALVLACSPRFLLPQQERPGVPSGAAEPGVALTRHGRIVFEADVAVPEPGVGSKVVLKENIEITGVKDAANWLGFVHSFADSTGHALLNAMPASASKKRGKIIVEFALRHSGSLNGAVSVTHSSGDESIDADTRLAIAKSAPFPPLPDSFPNAVAQFRVTFAYNHPHPLPSGASQ
jgi:TonB family protein